MRKTHLHLSAVYLVSLGFATLSLPLLGLTPEHEQAILKSMSANDLIYSADALNAEEQQWLLAYLLADKAKKMARVPGGYIDTYDTQLLQLRHEPTIQRHGDLIRRDHQPFEVRNSNQPRLIEFYEDGLLKNEPATPPDGGGDIPTQSDSLGCAKMMLYLTIRSREIPGETRAWASSLMKVFSENFGMNLREENIRSNEESRLIVRKWWAENKQAFKAREFDKVKPGLIHSELKGKPAEAAVTTDDPPITQPKEAPPAVATEPTRKESSILPVLLTGCLLLLLALSLWLSNRRMPPIR